jgi:hypothetical protein
MRGLKKIGILFLLWSVGMSNTSCKNESMVMNPEIHVHSRKLNVSWNGVIRLAAGIPVLENTDLKFHEVVNRRDKMPDTVFVFEFMHNFKDHVEIKAVISPQHNTIVFWLSPHNSHTRKASDFIGILFDSIPKFQAGTLFQKYGPVGAWTHPKVIQAPNELEDKDAQFFLWKYTDGSYAALLPLLGKGYVSSIGKYNGSIGSKAYHTVDGHNESEVPILALAFGSDPNQVVENIYRASLGMSDQLDSLKNQKSYPSLWKQLGWCSWNSMGHEVSHDTLIQAAESFTEHGIPIRWMLIDDGWSSVTGRSGKLTHFEPDNVKFPHGLKSTITQLKERYGIQSLGVWHTLNGYWAGIDPDSALGIKYREKLHAYTDKVTWTEEAPSVFFLPSPLEGLGQVFFEDWYTFLRGEGIDFIKVDNQLIAQKVADKVLPHSNTALHLQRHFQEPAQKHFGGKVLNCMCLTHDVLQHLGTSSVARSSEDYFPDNHSFHLKAGNEAVHVYNNILNNVWLHPLVWTDFDMFQSHREHGKYHALARILNNGPVYVTDYPNQHNIALLQAMCLADGTVLQSESPLLPLDKCLFQTIDHGILLAKSHYQRTLLIGAWNTTAHIQRTHFTMKELYSGLRGKHLLFDSMAQKIEVVEDSSTVNLTLGSLDSTHYLLFEHAPFCPIGLADKWVPVATVDSYRYDEKAAHVRLKATGEFLAYSERKVTFVESSTGNRISYWEEGNIVRVSALEETEITLHFT